jgi:DNA-directed RNA polymerase subunit K/omega
MKEMPEEFDSIFRYIVVVSQRAEQLINGAKQRNENQRTKHTLAAKDDVDAGLVEWRILTQEELDAQRQAIVDQFRAEMGGQEEEAAVEPEIPDVLPTAPEGEEAAAEPVEADVEEKDAELDRLQRLLGMVSRETDLDGDSDRIDLAEVNEEFPLDEIEPDGEEEEEQE